jgi:hypothetical protein
MRSRCFCGGVALRNGLPFDVRAPNVETKRAIEELENPAKRSKLKRYATTDELLAVAVESAAFRREAGGGKTGDMLECLI